MSTCGSNRVNIQTDTLVSAARKIGGIRRSESSFYLLFGDLKRGDYYQRIFWAPLMRTTGGHSADYMAGALYELGYLYEWDIETMMWAMQSEIANGTPHWCLYKTEE